LYRFSTNDLDDRKLISPAIHYASTAKITLSDFKLCPNSHRDKGNVVSSTTFLMFQYIKYTSNLVKTREAVTGGSGTSGLDLNLCDPRMEQILAEGAALSNNGMNNEK